jgi:hypothetical protein
MTIPDHEGFYIGGGPGAFTIKTYGFDALDKALKELPKKLQEKCIDNALKAGGNEIIPAIQKNIHSREMGLRKSKSMEVNKKKGTVCLVQIGSFRITARYRTKWGYRMERPWYAHMIEWGTQSHGASQTVYSKLSKAKKKLMRFPIFGKWVTVQTIKGITAQRPFTRGFDEKRESFLQKFGEYVDKYLTKYFKDNCLQKTW